jgi:hypothetical protein
MSRNVGHVLRRRQGHLTALAGTAAATVACLVSACGSSAPATLNPARVEHAIAASIQAQRHQTAAVTCPPAQPIAVHHQFRCVAQIGAQITPFLVTETDAAGQVSYLGVAPSATPVVDGSRVALAIENSIAAQRHLHTSVQCPSGIPLQQGLSFVCTARTPNGATTDFEVDQTDGHGHVTYRVR